MWSNQTDKKYMREDSEIFDVIRVLVVEISINWQWCLEFYAYCSVFIINGFIEEANWSAEIVGNNTCQITLSSYRISNCTLTKSVRTPSLLLCENIQQRFLYKSLIKR
jgi:hypothetical protein